MTTLFIVFFIVISITIVYLLIKNKYLSDGLLDHKLYIQKMHAELFPKETNFLFGDLLGEQKERNRIEEIEKIIKDFLDNYEKNKKALEKYLEITYTVKHDVSEGYEKSPILPSSGYMNACSGGSNVLFDIITTTADVCEKKKKPKKVAKKSKKK